MGMPGRTYQAGSGSYRFGFGGQEKSNEIKGEGNSYTAQFWEYDPRLVRRWNVDPRPDISISPYNAFAGNPIWFSDPLGDTTINGQKYEGAGFSSATTLETVKITGKRKSGNVAQNNASVNTKAFVLDAKFLQRTPGLDFMGKGALPLSQGVGKQGADVLEKPINTAGMLVEGGENYFKLTGNNKIADKFKVGGKFITGASIIHHLSTGDKDGLIVDAFEMGISKTPAAPYYYGAKVFNGIINSDYMQSGAYQGFKADFDDARRAMKSYGGKGWHEKLMYNHHLKRANQDYNAMQEIEKNWIKSHSSKH